MKRWTLDDIPWDRFEAEKVDPRILRIAKAAGLDPQAAWAPWASRLAYRLVRRHGAKTAQAMAT